MKKSASKEQLRANCQKNIKTLLGSYFENNNGTFMSSCQIQSKGLSCNPNHDNDDVTFVKSGTILASLTHRCTLRYFMLLFQFFMCAEG